MSNKYEFFEVRKLIDLVILEDLMPSLSDHQDEFYLSFSSTYINWFSLSDDSLTDDLDSYTSASILDTTQNSLLPAVLKYQQVNEGIVDSKKLTLTIPYFKFRNSTWRAFIVEPNCYPKFNHLLQHTEPPCFIIRLTRLQSFGLSESFENRFKSLLKSPYDIMLLVETQAHILNLTQWLTHSSNTLEYPMSGTSNVLPSGWRWLHINGSITNPINHWLTANTHLIFVPNIQEYLDASPIVSPQMQWLVTLSKNGSCHHAMKSKIGWLYLDDLSDKAWMDKTHLKLTPIQKQETNLNIARQATPKEEPSIAPALPNPLLNPPPPNPLLNPPPPNPLLNPPPPNPLLNPPPPNPLLNPAPINHLFVQQKLGFDPPIKEQGEQVEQVGQVNDESSPFIVNYEEILSGISSEASTLQVSMDHVENDLTINQKTQPKTSTTTVNDFFDEADIDHSEVLDISLSELPIQMTDHQIVEQGNEFEDPSFNQVKSALKRRPSIVINRAISTPKASTPSLVTSSNHIDKADDVDDDSFVYNTINQPYGNPEVQDLPTFNEQPNFRQPRPFQNTSEQYFDDFDDFNDLDDLDDLPTRVDLETSQVLNALHQERQGEVTCIVDSDDNANNQLHDEEIVDDEFTQIESHPSESSTPLSTSRAEALSRENTAKLKVRDFDMLTDVKDRSAIPSPPRPSHAPQPIKTTPIPPPPILPNNSVINAKFSDRDTKNSAQKVHKDRRSFADVIRSLTTKNKS
jgi:hypothetical protein